MYQQRWQVKDEYMSLDHNFCIPPANSIQDSWKTAFKLNIVKIPNKCVQTLKQHEDEVWSAHWNADGTLLATAGKGCFMVKFAFVCPIFSHIYCADGRVVIWDFDSTALLEGRGILLPIY